MICTLYSHNIGFEKITDTIQRVLPKNTITTSTQGESTIAEIEIKGSLFGSSQKIRISYRQKKTPSYKLTNDPGCPLSNNLKGLLGFISTLPSDNETVKSLFLQKIQTINAEFSIIQQQGKTPELKFLIQQLANEFDAVLFVQPNTIISKSEGQHFLDKNLELLLDMQGNCEVNHLDVKINSEYFEGAQTNLTEDQTTRKAESEKIIEGKKIKLNKNLPCIESEKSTTLRSAKEIAQRVSILAVTNLVAFNSISGEQALRYLDEYSLLPLLTPNEKAFLENPTEESKNYESWKCEGIWTLLWVLNKVSDLGFPDELCNLNNVDPENYPVGPEKDPNEFINAITSIRSKKEILDANDLYYRLDWACVDARMNNQQISGVHPGVVYERHYALNWLISYKGQDWDDVSCDT